MCCFHTQGYQFDFKVNAESYVGKDLWVTFDCGNVVIN